MIKSAKRIMLFGVLFYITGSSLVALAQEKAIDIRKTTYQNFLDADIEEAHDILVFHHGFIKGLNNDTIIQVDKLSALSDRVGDKCAENPDLVVLDVFQSIKTP